MDLGQLLESIKIKWRVLECGGRVDGEINNRE